VTHRHPGQRLPLFKALSLEADLGELLLISGEGGAGKTTLTKLIVGLNTPRYGKVFLGDTEIAALTPGQRAKLIGYMTQHTEIFAGTVRENIARMSEGTLADVTQAAKLAGIHDFILSLPHGYETPLIADTFDQLSGSQRKRIALARAFYGNPRLLVLDEPSANLDSRSRRHMESSLQALKDSGTILVVTQSVKSSQLGKMADKHLTLEGSSFDIREADEMPRKRRGSADLRRIK